MNEYECYEMYMALSRHFDGSGYDYFKYKGRLKNVNVQGWNKRKDKYFFGKLADRSDPKGFMVANLAKHGKLWIGDLINNPQYNDTYRQWKKYRAAFAYNFKQELEFLGDSFTKSIAIDSKDHYPKLLQAIMFRDVSAQSAIMIDAVTGCFDYWNGKLPDDMIWENDFRKLRVYSPFIDTAQLKPRIVKILLDFFN